MFAPNPSYVWNVSEEMLIVMYEEVSALYERLRSSCFGYYHNHIEDITAFCSILIEARDINWNFVQIFLQSVHSALDRCDFKEVQDIIHFALANERDLYSNLFNYGDTFWKSISKLTNDEKWVAMQTFFANNIKISLICKRLSYFYFHAIHSERILYLHFTLTKLNNINWNFVHRCSQCLHSALNLKNFEEVQNIFAFVFANEGTVYSTLSNDYGTGYAVAFLSGLYQGKWDDSRKLYYKVTKLCKSSSSRKFENYVKTELNFFSTLWDSLTMVLSVNMLEKILPFTNAMFYDELESWVIFENGPGKLENFARNFCKEFNITYIPKIYD